MNKIIKEIINEEKQVKCKANFLFDKINDYCLKHDLNLISNTLKELTKIYEKAELLTEFQNLIDNGEWGNDEILRIIYPIAQDYYYPDLRKMGNIVSGGLFGSDIYYTSNFNDEITDIVFGKEVYNIKIEATKNVLRRIATFILNIDLNTSKKSDSSEVVE